MSLISFRLSNESSTCENVYRPIPEPSFGKMCCPACRACPSAHSPVAWAFPARPCTRCWPNAAAYQPRWRCVWERCLAMAHNSGWTSRPSLTSGKRGLRRLFQAAAAGRSQERKAKSPAWCGAWCCLTTCLAGLRSLY